MADVVRHGRLRGFGNLEGRRVDDWVSACRKVEVAGARCRGSNKKIWTECVDDDMIESSWFADPVGSVQGFVEGLHGQKSSLATKK